MNISFVAKTNKDYCMVNTAIFHLKQGGTITVDRGRTEYSITNGILSMEWISCYIWAINGEKVFSEEVSVLSDNFAHLLEDAWVKFELEDDADDDYSVTDIVWSISIPDCIVSGSGHGYDEISNIRWTTRDIELALEERGITPTDADISNVLDRIDMDSYQDHCISYGWEQVICPAVDEYLKSNVWACDIDWDIDMDEVYEKLDDMNPRAASIALEIPYAHYSRMTTSERDGYAYDKFRHCPAELDKFLELPEKVKIPDTVFAEGDDAITDWLSDTYGYCINGYRLSTDGKE